MNNQQLIAVRNVYNSLKELMSSPYLQMSFMKKFPQIDTELKDILYIETLRYMIYLADADGYISSKELNLINYITTQHLSYETIEEIVEKNHDFYIDSMPEIPLTIRILCEVENTIYRNNSSLDESILKLAITYFKFLTMVVIDIDDNITVKERTRALSYLEMIEEYADDNTLSPFWGLDDE